ncbi:MAG: hypothetical protein SNJ78_08940, partial [Spirochaetales bacterium]
AMGLAFSRFLKEKRRSALNASPLIALGIDTRYTGPLIAEIFLHVLSLEGCRIRYLFILPIPELLAYVESNREIDGFVYVSASHNPTGYNGVKFGLREGVLNQAEANTLIQLFLSFVSDDAFMANALFRLSSLNNSIIQEYCQEVDKWKGYSEQAYRDFLLRMGTGTEDPQMQQRIFHLLQEGIKKEGCGVVIDFNGSSRSLSIDLTLLQELGIQVDTINSSPRAFAHEILPEGSALEMCRLRLEEQYCKDNRFLFGYVPDCDGDRGNLVYLQKDSPDSAPRAQNLEAQQGFALSVMAELSYRLWLADYKSKGYSSAPNTETSPNAFSSIFNPGRRAIVVNDPTSLRIDEIATLLGARVFRSEVGEANVVGLAQKLGREGWEVPIYGEGSNGGNITFPSRVRDPMATLVSLLKLLYLPKENSPLSLWYRQLSSFSTSIPSSSTSGLPGSGFSSPLTLFSPAQTLSSALSSLPAYQSLPVGSEQALFPIRCTDQSQFKTFYEQVFWEEWLKRKAYLKEAFGIESFQVVNYEGLDEKVGAGPAFRSGKETGGLKILFLNQDGKGFAFLWMRKSGTEPVFRLLVDLKGTDREKFIYLLDWHRSMISRADQRCLEQKGLYNQNLFYAFANLIGISMKDERIHRLLEQASLSKEAQDLLYASYRERKDPENTNSLYLSLPKRGIQILMAPNGILKSLFLYGKAEEGFSSFYQSLPATATFPQTQKELQVLLGDPWEQGQEEEGFFGTREQYWESYYFFQVKVHASYDTNLLIKRLTLSGI